MRRKNTRRFDPRYFMDEKTEVIKEAHLGRTRFTGGQVDIEPMSDVEQEEHTDAYYELFNFLATSGLPGDKPSEKLKSALRWIAKFEQGAPQHRRGTASREDTLAGTGGRGLPEPPWHKPE